MTILLIGETGVGKTAFLDLLANMCTGRHPERFAPLHVSGNELGGSAAGSQTKEPMLYQITSANGRQVRILDTPGLADTRGYEWDSKHKASIAEAIRQETETIDSVIILANGTQERLGIATQYALTVIAAMFPHSIMDNIAFVFTMVSNPFQFNFQRSALQPELRNAKIWAIENPLAQWIKFSDYGTSDECLVQDMRDTLSTSYKKALRAMNDFFQWHDTRTTQPVHAINDLYTMTTGIEASIANVLARIAEAEKYRMKLTAFQARLSEQEQIKQANANYESLFRKPVYEHTPTEFHNTLCIHSGCYKNCHQRCGLGFTLEREQLGEFCLAFRAPIHTKHADGGYACNACGHSSMYHQHHRAEWVTSMKEERSTDKLAKERFLAAETEKEKLEILHTKISENIKAMEANTCNDEDELSGLCLRFGELALSGSFSGHISSTIHLLELRRKAMQGEGVHEDGLQRMDEHIRTLRQKKAVVESAEKSKRGKWAIFNWLTG
ncbi:hypothetical protein BDN71DRAFT_1396317 [Pleurotus eryngii]|uniref:GATA-type domain-containing protein n=1 Tax=Pleurotus eryngii TaxID=5323 RepID=A0A9P6D681_PLEER|nr:hypothetical protein BDN71DRAFT_1396317 [Pleurotus eryngii]